MTKIYEEEGGGGGLGGLGLHFLREHVDGSRGMTFFHTRHSKKLT